MNAEPRSYVIKTPKGVHGCGRPLEYLDAEVRETFRYALAVYSFMLPMNTKIDAVSWILAIRCRFVLCPRRERVCEAIRAVLYQ